MYARDTALIATPIGGVRIEGDDATIHRISIDPSASGEQTSTGAAVGRAVSQLREWFAGTRTTFDPPLAPAASPRGQALRDGMVDINYGDTMSYGALARLLGSGPRAVGQACARNPFPIVVPCHRVLGARGSIGHYSGGAGLSTKRWLLKHEHDMLTKGGR